MYKYSPGDISSRSAGDLIWKNTPISKNIMTPHTATHKQQPEHFGPKIFILNYFLRDIILRICISTENM